MGEALFVPATLLSYLQATPTLTSLTFGLGSILPDPFLLELVTSPIRPPQLANLRLNYVLVRALLLPCAMPGAPTGDGDSPSAPPPPPLAPAGAAAKTPRPRLPARSSSGHMAVKLAPDLEHFLARYPHPAFALRASALYDALVSRREPYAPPPVDLAGVPTSATVPAYGTGAAAPVGTREGAKGRTTKLSSREQYEGGVGTDDSISPSPTPPPPQGDGRQASGSSGDTSAGDTEAETASSLGPSMSAIASPDTLSPVAASPSESPGPPSVVSFPQSRVSQSSSSGDSHPVVASHRPPKSHVSFAGTHVSRAHSSMSASSQRRAADAGVNPRAHARAERILASAFEAPELAGSGADPQLRGSYLEGGAQKSHDPSRTAEGAVKAMYEQREQREQDEKEHDVQVAIHEQGLEAARLVHEQGEFVSRDRWSGRNPASSNGSGGRTRSDRGTAEGGSSEGTALGGLSLRELLTPVWRNGKWCELMAIRNDAKPRASGQTEQEHRTGILDKATAHGPPPGDGCEDQELGLLTLLSRVDVQECLAMLTNVVEPLDRHKRSEDHRQAEIPLAQLDHTVLLELDFPETSIYRHPPGSSFTHHHSAADSQPPAPRSHGARSAASTSTGSAGTDSTGRSTASRAGSHARGTAAVHPILPHNPPPDRALPVYSAQNAYAHSGPPPSATAPAGDGRPQAQASAAPDPNQNPAVPPVHRGVQQASEIVRPFLQVVATLQPENDLVICTTILANMPLPVTITGSPEKHAKDEVRRDQCDARAPVDAREARELQSRDESEKTVEGGRKQRRDEQKARAPHHSKPRAPHAGKPPASSPVRSEPGASAATPVPSLLAPLPSVPSFGSTSPFPSGHKPSRPPLAQRGTSHSSISNASSSGSTVIGAATSQPPTVNKTGPLLDAASSESQQAMLLPLPTDNLPVPFESRSASGPGVGFSSLASTHTTTVSPSEVTTIPAHPYFSPGMRPRAALSSDAPRPLGIGLSGAAPSPQPPQHYVEPTYGLTESAPLQTPSVSKEIKELWVDLSERDRDTAGAAALQANLPRGFVLEKESRAAVRRLGAPGGSGRRRDPREADNVHRERERQRQAKKRDKEWKKEQDERSGGREGLGELPELDEPPEGEDDADEEDEVEGEGEREGDDDGYEDVLGFDEEHDDTEMDRLRARTRTGSTSSAGSAHEREEAAAEARRAQEQQEGDERERLRVKGEKRAQARESRHAREEEYRERDARRRQEERTRYDEQNHRARTPLTRLDGGPEVARSTTGTHVSVSSSTASSGVASVHTPGLTGGPGLTIHEAPLASDVYGGAAPTYSYGDPFLDTVAQTPCGRTILSVDWAKTSLGDIRQWGAELRSHVMAMLASPFHTALWYGTDNVLLYNDAYARLLGPSKHPTSMGKSGAEGWSELWDVLGPLAGQVFMGKTISFSDHCNCIVRNGMLEETYHSWAYITLRDAQARIIGYQNPSFETTARVIAERRLGTLRELSQLTQLARTTKEFCTKAMRALAGNPLDIPFAILYTCETLAISPGRRTKGTESSNDSGNTRLYSGSNGKGRSTDSGRAAGSGLRATEPAGTTAVGPDPSSTIARMRLTLQGSIGVPKDHPSMAEEVNVLLDTAMMQQDAAERSSASSVSSASGTNSTNDGNSSSTVWPFIEALQTRKPVFISDLGDRTTGFAPRGWPDAVNRAVVMPIITEGSTLPKALLIVGLNPRRPFNAVMAQFFNLVSRTLSTGLLGIEVTEEQTRKSRELSELNDARQAFFANISHELRTPLTLILGPLEDVLMSKTAALDGEDRERLEVVQRNAHRLLNMVNTLLDFSRLESGKMNSVYRPTLLGPRTADLAALFRAAVERGGIDFRVEIDDDEWATKGPFYLSDEMYEKVVFNLIGNSYKYTLAGCITVKVSFTATEGIVSIEDSGVGIADEDLESIFDRFHRVDSAARSFEGTGIGLSLVLELVKALGGTISVDSKVGTGSKFTVRLPRGHAHLPPEVVDHEPYELVNLPPRAAQSLAIINDAASWRIDSQPDTTAKEGAVSEKKLVNSSGRRSSDPESLPSVFNLDKASTVCLVVDDNPQLRSFIGNTLSRTFTVVEKPNGEEALKYALEHPEISIVVTDLAMPVMGGRELLAALRKNPATSLIPVIFLSAQAGSEARVDALLLGADDYIVKPFQARELLARVNVHLQLGHMRKELERRVTERTAALIESEKKLKELAEQHQTLALVSPVGIFQCATDGKVVFTNPRYMEITQHPPGKPFEDWEDDIHPDDLPRVRELWNDAISNWRADKGVSTFEFRYRAGNWAQLEVRSFDKGFIGSITDISHQKEVEAFHIREVEQRAQEAEENRRNTEMFLDMSSHELRNPLSGVWQNAEVVAASLEKFVDFLDELRAPHDAPLDHAAVEELHGEMLENVDAIESIMLCASHQTRIADDILNVSKLNMGLLSINVAPFDLFAAVREVVKTFEVQSHQQQINLAVEKGTSLEKLGVDWIVADSGRFKQITYNFLTNALKYTVDSSRKSVTVHIDAYAGPPPTPANAMRIAAGNQSFEPPEDCVWCVVGVQDSGKGLSGEQLKLLFARFSQANPKSDQYGGSGLGLYVSKKLVELHRGFIEVESELGSGSTFRFAIPAPRAARPVDESRLSPGTPMLVGGSSSGASSASGKRSKRPTSSSGRPSTLTSLSSVGGGSAAFGTGLAPLHILVVEDNLINQKVMMRQLRMQNFQVSLAGDGQQALDVLAEDARATASAGDSADGHAAHNPIRCVLMDIEMPVLDGMSAIRELRRREKAGEIGRRYPVCAVTGNAREGQKKQCIEAGFDDVATKPYRLAELLQQISTLTGLPLPAPK
ncbi:hypothetical protein JCM3770_006359 [Rhodotorula araucariae]